MKSQQKATPRKKPVYAFPDEEKPTDDISHEKIIQFYYRKYFHVRILINNAI